ncbi:mads box transcription factor mcm1 [Moniliophthora roreri MCA 2997]|uniref:Mads box transcription factor mcm1 n=1 Tax=Moniliophthora roreri (strain MCA 2997) TaxID=1381753 RepID=V2XSE4_MONRO|nr:mads box transcription factor mcm1 [Moniliophthora roreri MCA 2997]
MRKRPRMDPMANPGQPDPQSHPGPGLGDDAFINDHDAVDSGADDDDDEDKPKSDKKAGRRKIKIEFIQDKSRRHITFSKRKAGIMKKAYELSTLTGTQVLLLVVSETGLVYTFTTAKLQPLVTQPEGKNLIQACLNAPHGTLPSTMPVGAPLGRAANVGPPSGPPPASNMPGGLSISGQSSGGVKEDDDAGQDEDEAARGGRASTGDKRRRASSNAAAPTSAPNSRGSGPTPTSPHAANASIPAPLSIPTGSTASPTSAHPQSQPQINLGSPTSPQQAHSVPPPGSGSYSQSYPPPQSHQDGSGMYGATQHMVSGYSYGHSGQPQGQLGGLANAAAAQHWQPPPQQQVGQNTHYTRR